MHFNVKIALSIRVGVEQSWSMLRELNAVLRVTPERNTRYVINASANVILRMNQASVAYLVSAFS